MGVSEPVLRVLFVCTGNTCRSPMAQAILRDRLGPDAAAVEVDSCGVSALEGSPASAGTLEVAARHGAGLKAHRSRRLTRGLVERADLVLAMEPEHVREVLGLGIPAEKVHLLSEWQRPARPGDAVADPIGGSLEAYEECWRRIALHVERLLPHLREELKARRA